MNTRALLITVSLLAALALIAAACSPQAVPTVAPVQVEKPGVKGTVAVVVPTKAPATAPTAALKPGAPTPQAISKAGLADVSTSPYREGRMIVKNGDMNLLVADTDAAIDRVTSIAIELGGYLISSKSWMQDGFKYASLTVGVPVDQFETTMRRVRGLAIQVLDENATGQDVSTEYVDLQSRLTNLEATAARIRDFLKQAKDVDESLQVNAKLAEVTAEIEQVKGRMTYLKDRAAYSTLTVSLQPQRPTPTPTPTPTATPTPTPAVWRPDKTFQAASTTLLGIGQGVGDILIWVVVVGVPVVAPLIALWLIGRSIGRRMRSQPAKREPPLPRPAPMPEPPQPAQPLQPALSDPPPGTVESA